MDTREQNVMLIALIFGALGVGSAVVVILEHSPALMRMLGL